MVAYGRFVTAEVHRTEVRISRDAGPPEEREREQLKGTVVAGQRDDRAGSCTANPKEHFLPDGRDNALPFSEPPFARRAKEVLAKPTLDRVNGGAPFAGTDTARCFPS